MIEQSLNVGPLIAQNDLKIPLKDLKKNLKDFKKTQKYLKKTQQKVLFTKIN